MMFQESLVQGKAGETAIACWLRQRGFSVLPAYEKIDNDYKGPALFTPSGTLIAPDLLAMSGRKTLWVEAKHKSAFTWHRITRQWTTGIDLHHYEQYCRVNDETPFRVMLMFLHEQGTAKDSPDGCPTGLYGHRLDFLRKHEHHRHSNWGRHGMVYWWHGDLIKYASLDALARVQVLASYDWNEP